MATLGPRVVPARAAATGARGEGASMPELVIPEAVDRFLASCIPSVAHLEALLLLRQNPSQEWTRDLVAARLFIRPEEATRVLADLAAAGLSAGDPARGEASRYAPLPDLAALVNLTADTYRTRLVAVTQRIHARQSNSIQAFADAFRIRKG